MVTEQATSLTEPQQQQQQTLKTADKLHLEAAEFAMRQFHSTNQLKRALVLCLLGFLLLFIAVISLTVLLNVKYVSQKQTICTSKSCIRAANLILENMDQSADPCDDFYMFACGSFQATKRIKEDETKINEFSILRDKLAYMVSDLLTEPINSDDTNSTINAKILFKSCMNEGECSSQKYSVSNHFYLISVSKIKYRCDRSQRTANADRSDQ